MSNKKLSTMGQGKQEKAGQANNHQHTEEEGTASDTVDEQAHEQASRMTNIDQDKGRNRAKAGRTVALHSVLLISHSGKFPTISPESVLNTPPPLEVIQKAPPLRRP